MHDRDGGAEQQRLGRIEDEEEHGSHQGIGCERQQEFAVRLALGASRYRLGLQVLIEGAWLAAAAMLVALPLAALGVEGLKRGLPPGVVRWVAGYEYLQLDERAMATTAVLGIVAVLRTREQLNPRPDR